MDGFGLAQIKPEGHCFEIDSGITTPALMEEFNWAWGQSYEACPWWWKPFANCFREQARKFWIKALLTDKKRRLRNV